jgi:hypothetical protein
MKSLPAVALVLYGVLFAAAQTPPAEPPVIQPPPQDTAPPAQTRPKKGRARLLAKLNDDLGVAITNGKLDKKSVNRLEKNREALRQALDPNAKQKPDPKVVQKNLNSIQKVFKDKSEAFRPEDRAAVLQDLLDLRPAQQARSRPPRPVRVPRTPIPQRRWPRY